MTAPQLLRSEVLRFSKQNIWDALAGTYPTQFAGKVLSDLVWYGDDPEDSSFTAFDFIEVSVDATEGNVDRIRFEKGSIIQLMQVLDPAHFGDKTVEQLDYYQDDPDDASKVMFVFRLEEV